MTTYMLRLYVMFSAISMSQLQDNFPFKTVVEKVVADYEPTDESSFTIPSGQCSGLIDQSLLCGAGGVAGAVRVEVRERAAFAAVHVERYLRNVSVVRAADPRGRCAGPARVALLVGCLVAPAPPAPPAPARLTARRRRRALRPL